MQSLSAAQLVGVWERGVGQSSLDRALTMLADAYPEMTRAELVAWSVGERDARLLALRERQFGGELKSFAECPRCSSGLEFSLDVNELRNRPPSAIDASSAELIAGDIRLRLRPLDSADLQAAADCRDVEGARQILLERCVVEAKQNGESLAVGDLPADCVERLSAHLAVIESQADTMLDLQCVGCGHVWQLAVDVAAFLWSEIAAAAKRCLNEVHTLAWAYGWGEADILAMSPARRQFYLEQVS
ncbi:MAG TPA: phage baseplate protein [Verrucomicrobiae bacterium]|nr:phage baseplate protein [Verrucomicrobiae bacterium]